MTQNENVIVENHVLHNNFEQNDSSPKCNIYRKGFCFLFSIVTHIAHVVSDFNLISQYNSVGHINYMILTIIFIFIPSLITMVISLRMYRQDSELNPNSSEHHTLISKIVDCKILWLIIILLQLAPFLRYIAGLKYVYYIYKYQKLGDIDRKKTYFDMLIKEQQDISFLNLFSCYLETAPHQVLHLSLIIINYNEKGQIDDNFYYQASSLIFSFITMSTSMANFQQDIRLAQEYKANIGCFPFHTIHMCWHFCITVSRIVTISVAAALFTTYTVIACAIHWLAMFVWTLIDPYGIQLFCRDQRKSPHIPLTFKERACTTALCMVYGVIHIFLYLKPVDGPSCWKFFFYDLLCFTENIVACIIWHFYGLISAHLYTVLIYFSCFGLFVLGVIIKISYYIFFHPTKKEKMREYKLVKYVNGIFDRQQAAH